MCRFVLVIHFRHASAEKPFQSTLVIDFFKVILIGSTKGFVPLPLIGLRPQISLPRSTFTHNPAYYLINNCSLTKGIFEFLWNVGVWAYLDSESLHKQAVWTRPSLKVLGNIIKKFPIPCSVICIPKRLRSFVLFFLIGSFIVYSSVYAVSDRPIQITPVIVCSRSFCQETQKSFCVDWRNTSDLHLFSAPSLALKNAIIATPPNPPSLYNVTFLS